jgi:hypothetical protein
MEAAVNPGAIELETDGTALFVTAPDLPQL